jgi:tetratricopeptide (TPR) repeat protein
MTLPLKLPLRVLLVSIVSTAIGCAGQGQTAGKARETLAKPARVEVEPLIVTQSSADTVARIHDRGMLELQKGAFVAAERDFDLCVRAAPVGPYAASALYHGALALDELGRFEPALDRFLEVAQSHSDHPLGDAARLRAVRLACHLERWQVARAQADGLLNRNSRLSPGDDILVRGALALEAVSRGDDSSAQIHVARARNVIESAGFDAPGRIPRDVAAVYFALGEIRRLRAERIRLAPPPQDFAAVLEKRCELILAGQAAYSDAMRAFDAHWSTMAGFRIGELYASLHQELMNIVPPDRISDARQRLLFEGAMRLRYSVLVQKALNLMKHTLAMAERTGEQSEWVVRAKAAEQDLERRLLDEQAALDSLPYSRQALEHALNALAQASAKVK